MTVSLAKWMHLIFLLVIFYTPAAGGSYITEKNMSFSELWEQLDAVKELGI